MTAMKLIAAACLLAGGASVASADHDTRTRCGERARPVERVRTCERAPRRPVRVVVSRCEPRWRIRLRRHLRRRARRFVRVAYRPVCTADPQPRRRGRRGR